MTILLIKVNVNSECRYVAEILLIRCTKMSFNHQDNINFSSKYFFKHLLQNFNIFEYKYT